MEGKNIRSRTLPNLVIDAPKRRLPVVWVKASLMKLLRRLSLTSLLERNNASMMSLLPMISLLLRLVLPKWTCILENPKRARGGAGTICKKKSSAMLPLT